jgi:hypothetical protein
MPSLQFENAPEGEVQKSENEILSLELFFTGFLTLIIGTLIYSEIPSPFTSAYPQNPLSIFPSPFF